MSPELLAANSKEVLRDEVARVAFVSTGCSLNGFGTGSAIRVVSRDSHGETLTVDISQTVSKLIYAVSPRLSYTFPNARPANLPT